VANPTRQSLRGQIQLPPDAEAAAAILDGKEAPAEVAPSGPPEAEDGDAGLPSTTTTINLSIELLEALQRTAFNRAALKRRASAKGRGGRASVSAIVVEVLEKYRDDWEEKSVDKKQRSTLGS
jgi:hypothetical protein